MPVKLMVIDDDADDLGFFQFAMALLPGVTFCQMFLDAGDSLAVLTGEADRPDIIFLDLNMPRIDGFEFLRRKAEMAGIADIPVAVLTTSDADYMKSKSLSLGATCFITKPVTVGELAEKVRDTLHYVFPADTSFSNPL